MDLSAPLSVTAPPDFVGVRRRMGRKLAGREPEPKKSRTALPFSVSGFIRIDAELNSFGAFSSMYNIYAYY